MSNIRGRGLPAKRWLVNTAYGHTQGVTKVRVFDAATWPISAQMTPTPCPMYSVTRSDSRRPPDRAAVGAGAPSVRSASHLGRPALHAGATGSSNWLSDTTLHVSRRNRNRSQSAQGVSSTGFAGVDSLRSVHTGDSHTKSGEGRPLCSKESRICPIL